MNMEIRLLGAGAVKYTIDHDGVKVRLQNHTLELWHVTEWKDDYPYDTLIYRLRVGRRIIEGIGTGYETAGNDLEDKLQALGWQDIKF